MKSSLPYNQASLFGTNMYHNSVPIRDEKTLEDKEKKAKSLANRILELMKSKPYTSFTPSQIHLMFGQQWPITSVRARMSTMASKKGGELLVMTGELRPGLFGHPEGCWKYNSGKTI